MINAETLSNALGGKQTGRGFLACCPAHDDKHPSLSIDDGDNGQPIVKCRAGCPQDNVINALQYQKLWPTYDQEVLPQEINEAKKRNIAQKKERIVKQDKAANKTKKILATANGDPTQHAYAIKKGVKLGGLIKRGVWPQRGWKDALLLPLYDSERKVTTISAINKDGSKDLLKDGLMKGAFYPIGNIKSASKVFIGEGLATVAAVCDSTNLPGIVAVNAGNLKPVAKAIRFLLPDTEITIIADDDQKPDNSNPGKTAAIAAASAIKGKIAIPELNKKADAWDVWNEQGPEAVKKMIDAAITQNSNSTFNDNEFTETKVISVYDDEGRLKQKGTILLEIAEDHDLFKGDDNLPYAAYWLDGHKETWSLRSSAYHSRLAERFYRATGKGVSRTVISDAIDTISSKALFDGGQRPIFKRIARKEDSIVIDMGDPEWSSIIIDKKGWKSSPSPEIHFLRNANAKPYPRPADNGDISLLWKYLNVREEDRPLAIGFIVACFNPNGPYFALVLTGEQGTGKSTFAKVIRTICDPSTAPLRPPPKDEKDFMVGAVNNWLLTLDNLSGMKDWLSDALCRVLTGGAMAGRELYSNDTEHVIQMTRPALINGIDNITNRPDLAERSIIFDLVPIPPNKRKPECLFWKEFDKDLPQIFSAILDGISAALLNIDKIKIPNLPRMADPTMWASAAETAFDFRQGSFLESYHHNQERSVQVGLESSPFATAIRDLMAERDNWNGKLEQLMAELRTHVDEDTLRSKAWPKSPNWAVNFINRHGASLRKVGINVNVNKIAKGSLIDITKTQMSQISTKFAQEDAVQGGMTPTDKQEKLRKLRNCETNYDAISQMTQKSSFVGGDESQEWETL